MTQIKLHAEKFSRGLKLRLAVLTALIVVVAMSSTFTFAGLYLYNKNHPETATSSDTNLTKPEKVSDSTTVKPGTGSTDPKKVASTPKPSAPAAPVVVVEPVASAPSSSVNSLTSAPAAPSAPVVSDPGDASAAPIRVSTTTYSSTNWSGYMATGGNFTTVSGSWVVPTVTGVPGIESGDGAWVGIGGVTSGDLIQAGTLHFVTADGSLMYGAFYEVLPAAATIVDMSVSPGDLISVSITETSLNQWLIIISNLTNGSSVSRNLSYISSHSSAEWIEEDPSYSSGDLIPLTNFGTVNFSGCNSTVDGYLYGIADIGASPITMVAHRQPIAVPSAVSGTGFSVTRY